MNENEARLKLDLHKLENGRSLVFNSKPFEKLPRSLWKSLLSSLNIDTRSKWADISKYQKESLMKCLIMKNYLIALKFQEYTH